MIVKPTRLGVLRRVSSDTSGHHLRLTALGAFDLRSGGDFLTEARLWQTAAPALGTTVLDAGMPKTCAEVLVAGDACAPAGRPVRGLVVNLELGPIRKRLAVFGRRWWRHGPDGPLMSEPEPFERVPLGWANAFGGPGCAENPQGKGSDAKAEIGRGKPSELPMVEAPDALIADIAHRPAPAGLGPRREDAPSRLAFAGDYDDAWLRDDFPGPGRGFDARYYNTACPDQQTRRELRGDEPFRITSMHPEHPDLRGRLPGFRVRAFARRGDACDELPVRIDTVWLFPGALMGVVLFRSGLAVADKEASDVPHVMLAYERLHEPGRSPEHYRTAFAERTGEPELATLKLLDERPLRPERLPEEVEAVEAERRALAEEIERRQEQAREHAVAGAFALAGVPAPPAGLFRDDTPHPVDIPVVTPGEIERMEVDLAGLKTRLDAIADDVQRQGQAQWARTGDDVARMLPQAAPGLDSRSRALLDDRLASLAEQSGGTFDPAAIGAPEAGGAGPATTDGGLAGLFEHAGRLLEDESGAPEPERGQAGTGGAGAATSVALRRARNRALGTADEDDPFATMRAALSAQKDAMQGSATAVGPAGATPGADCFGVETKGALAAAASAGRGAMAPPDFAPSDPRAAWFEEMAQVLASRHAATTHGAAPEPGLDEAQDRLAQGCERIEAFKAHARRSSPEAIAPDEPLTDADAASLGALALELVREGRGLKGRDLAGADLSGADLSGMDLDGVFLERAKLVGTRFAGATLSRAVLTGADLSGADLTGADLTDSNLSGAELARGSLRDARLDRAQLVRCRLDGADLGGASVTEMCLIECSLADVRLPRALVRDVQFVKCDLSRIALDGARLHSVVLVESSTAGFRAPDARFERCALIDLQGEDADLTGAEFVRSGCMGDVNLRRARMAGLDSRRSGWRGADLSGADLTGARLDECDLGETNLAGACMHRASLRRAILHKANAAGANLYGATLLEAQARDADFTRANLHWANLYSTDLADARFTLCDLTGANLTLSLMTKPANAR